MKRNAGCLEPSRYASVVSVINVGLSLILKTFTRTSAGGSQAELHPTHTHFSRPTIAVGNMDMAPVVIGHARDTARVTCAS